MPQNSCFCVSEQLFVSPSEKQEKAEVGGQGKQKVGKVYEDEEEDFFNAPEVSTQTNHESPPSSASCRLNG